MSNPFGHSSICASIHMTKHPSNHWLTDASSTSANRKETMSVKRFFFTKFQIFEYLITLHQVRTKKNKSSLPACMIKNRVLVMFNHFTDNLTDNISTFTISKWGNVSLVKLDLSFSIIFRRHQRWSHRNLQTAFQIT